MFARKRPDIGWRDLAYGLYATIAPGDEARSREAAEQCWGREEWVATFSVRSGFDLFLRVLNLPRGSEVLMSAITIAHMAEIVRLHGLVPVPVDLDPDSLAVDLDALKRQITPRSKIFVVAHLFGARMDLAPLAEVAKEHGLLLLEDCAQAFVGRSYAGQDSSDLVMFSFGTIKTATALGGGLFRCKDAEIARQMRQIQSTYPVQRRREYGKKVMKYAALKALTTRPGFSAFRAAVSLGGGNYDTFINASARGFPGSDLLHQIRQRPGSALLRMLKHRVTTYTEEEVNARRETGAALARLLPEDVFVPGVDALHHTHWVFPVSSRNPERLIQMLKRHGFDATRGTSSLQAIEEPGQDPPRRSRTAMSNLVYVPVYPPMAPHHIEELATLIVKAET